MKSEIRILAKEFRLPATNFPVVQYSIEEVNTEDELTVISSNPLGFIASHITAECMKINEESFVLDKMKEQLKTLKRDVKLLEEALNKSPIYLCEGDIVTKNILFGSLIVKPRPFN